MANMGTLAYIGPGHGFCACHEPWDLLLQATILGGLAFLVVLMVVLAADVTRASWNTRAGVGCSLGMLALAATYLLVVEPHWPHADNLELSVLPLVFWCGAPWLALIAWGLGASLDRFGRALHDTEFAGLTYRRLPVPGRR